MPNGQMGRVTISGPRRRRSPYRAMIEAQAPYLPEMYRLKEQKAEREREFELQQRGLDLQREQQEQSEKATRMANIIGAGSVATQGYMGYKMGAGGAATTTTPQTGAVVAGGGSAAAPAGGGALATGGGEGAGFGAGQTSTAGGGAGTSALGYLFAAYVGYKLWQAEKKRGAKYPGQPLLQSIGKSIGKSDIGKRLGLG